MNDIAHSYPASVLPPGWWKTSSAIARPYLKLRGKTLLELAASLDNYQKRGIDTLEIFAPCQGGTCYNGLDTIDYYKIDPAIGTMDDLQFLIKQAHAHRMAIILFMNLGYAHEQFPAFLKACDDINLGIDSPETHMFLWSETGQDKMDRNLAPYFMNDLHGNWRWSERASKYFWVKWEGENGGYHLPQFNFGDIGWQTEVQNIIRYWLATGIDGMVIDAVNWYINCTWEICHSSITDTIREADNQFCQPEGAGGFHDDPVPWVEQAGWNCIMDYSVKLWWENVDLIRDALLSGDPRPIEASLQQYRDRVVTAGGVCYIDPPSLDGLPYEAQIMGAALAASIGEMLLLLGDLSLPVEPTEPESFTPRVDQFYHKELIRLIQLRKQYPVLCAGAERRQVPTSDDSLFYAFLRGSSNNSILAIFNFQPEHHVIKINREHLSSSDLEELGSNDHVIAFKNEFFISLPAFGYKFFKILT